MECFNTLFDGVHIVLDVAETDLIAASLEIGVGASRITKLEVTGEPILLLEGGLDFLRCDLFDLQKLERVTGIVCCK